MIAASCDSLSTRKINPVVRYNEPFGSAKAFGCGSRSTRNFHDTLSSSSPLGTSACPIRRTYEFAASSFSTSPSRSNIVSSRSDCSRISKSMSPNLNSPLIGGGVASTGAVFFCAIVTGQKHVSPRQKHSAKTMKLLGFWRNITGEPKREATASLTFLPEIVKSVFLGWLSVRAQLNRPQG